MQRTWSILGIDVAGAGLCALLLGLGVSAAWPGKDAAGRDDLAGDLAAEKKELTTLGAELEKQKDRGDRGRVELSAAGRMPDPTPPEVHLQTLSELAAQHHLVVMRQLPLAPREYPGLLEQRFAMEVTGSAANLVRFFRAVELAPAWTDISYLTIDRGKDDDANAAPHARLTFSAFSTARDNKGTAAGTAHPTLSTARNPKNAQTASQGETP